MTTTTASNWFRTGAAASVRQYVRSREHVIFLFGAALLFLHLLDDAFVHPEAMSSASDNILTGAAGAMLVIGLAVAYPRVGTAWRSAACLGVGLFSVVTAVAIHIPHMVAVSVSGSDFTAMTSLATGLILTGTGVWLAWKSMPRFGYKLAIVPAVPMLLFCAVVPVTLAVFLTNTPRQALDDSSPMDYGFAYESVTFENEAGNTLAAWYIPSQNGAAVVLLHGSGTNRTKTLEHGVMLAEHGYGALMIDARGYGESEGSPIAIGWTAGDDVAAAARYLQTRPDVDPERIGALGLSMGGEAVLLAAGEGAPLAAVVADGVEARTLEEAAQQPGLGIIDWMQSPVMLVTMTGVELLSGVEPPTSNKELITKIDAPVLLISMSTGPEYNWTEMLDREGGDNIDHWATGVGHIDGFREVPQEYETRVTALFDEALLGE